MRIPKSWRTSILPAVVCAVRLSAISTVPASAQSSAWREEHAYTLGVEALIYGSPWTFLPQLRWQWVTQPPSAPTGGPYAPLNEFWDARRFNTAADRTGGSPNNGTLYSIAWVDLSTEPLILSAPAITDRYYTLEMSSMDSDNFAYTGTAAGDYAIVGPGGVRELPPGVTELPTSRTPCALILARTLVYGDDDLANVHDLQDQYELTPWSRWGTSDEPNGDRDVWAPYPTTDPLAVWKTMNRAMTENPPNVPSQPSLVDSLAAIGVGPGRDIEVTDSATKRGLERVAQEAMAVMHGFNPAGGTGREVNGWTYPPSSLGRAGQHDDFLTRAASQCWAGIVANDPEEAISLNTSTDSGATPLNGANDYLMRFPPNGLSDAGAFWSVSMYGTDHNLVDNPRHRCKLGTYPEGLMRFDPDGGPTIYVQHESPGADRESNWLPAPADDFPLILRTSLPGTSVLDQTREPPPVAVVSWRST